MPSFIVSKSILVDTSQENVYDTLRDFKQWPAWSPWIIVEPDCQLDYASDGNSYTWDGSVIGTGDIKITSEEKPHIIRYQISFVKPFKSSSEVTLRLEPVDNYIKITWTLYGSLPIFLFWMKPMMRASVGMDYLRGLNMLKDYLEKGSVSTALTFIGEEIFPGFSYIGIRKQSPIQEIAKEMEKDFEKLNTLSKELSIQQDVKAFSIYHKWDIVNATCNYTVGFPLSQETSSIPQDFTMGKIPSCQVYTVKHKGPYRHIGNAWSAVMMRSQSRILKQKTNIHPFEIYENSPKNTAENALITKVHFPIK
ncbi:MAG: SRPBCC family protein [Verrucomicrobiota bacterium]